MSRETRGEAGLIYEQAVMGPLGKVGTHDRPLEIRAHKYVSDVNSGGWTPQLPSTSRRHRDQGRTRQPSWTEGSIRTFPGWAGLCSPADLDPSLFLTLPLPHHCSHYLFHRDLTSSLNPAPLGILSQDKPAPEFFLNSSVSPSSLTGQVSLSSFVDHHGPSQVQACRPPALP